MDEELTESEGEQEARVKIESDEESDEDLDDNVRLLAPPFDTIDFRRRVAWGVVELQAPPPPAPPAADDGNTDFCGQ
jgi:hypothetical protein